MRWLKHPVCPGAMTTWLPLDAVVQSVRVDNVTTWHMASQQSKAIHAYQGPREISKELTRSDSVIAHDLEASIRAGERLDAALIGAIVVEDVILDPRLLAAAALVEADVDKVGNLADGEASSGIWSSRNACGREGEGQDGSGKLHSGGGCLRNEF